MIMSPYEIEILLHYYTHADDWHGPSFGSSLHIDTMKSFEESGLLKRTGKNEWEITDRGRFYVERGLCQVPLPVAEMHIPWNEVTTSAIAKMHEVKRGINQ